MKGSEAAKCLDSLNIQCNYYLRVSMRRTKHRDGDVVTLVNEYLLSPTLHLRGVGIVKHFLPPMSGAC